MHMSWEFDYRGSQVEIYPILATFKNDKAGLYFIKVNGIITQRNIDLIEVVSWMANAMMNCRYK